MPEAVATTMQTALRHRLQRGLRHDRDRLVPARQPARSARKRRLAWACPAPGVDSRIVDPDTLQELPHGEVGEIVTRAPQVMQRLLERNPQADREAFVEIDGRRFLRTGDLGLRRRGRLLLHARPAQANDQRARATRSGRPRWRTCCTSHPADARGLRHRDARCAPGRGGEGAGRAQARCGARCDRADRAGAAQRWPSTRRRASSSSSTALPKSSTGKILWRELQEQHRAAATRNPMNETRFATKSPTASRRSTLNRPATATRSTAECATGLARAVHRAVEARPRGACASCSPAPAARSAPAATCAASRSARARQRRLARAHEGRARAGSRALIALDRPVDRRGRRPGLRRRLQPRAGGRLHRRVAACALLPVVHAARPRAGLRRALHAAAHRRRAAREGADAVGARSGGRRGAGARHRDRACTNGQRCCRVRWRWPASFVGASPMAVSLVKRALAATPARPGQPHARGRGRRAGAVLRQRRRTARRCSGFSTSNRPAFQWPATGQE